VTGPLLDPVTPRALMTGITKRFGALTANHHVDLTLRAGEVHALLGENGAGKSTLMNMLFGLYRPDEGEIRLRDELVELGSPRDALARGVGMVHQHFMLVPDFTVAENMVLGGARSGRLGMRRRGITAIARDLLQRHEIDLDPATPARLLTVEQQQQVEIVKVLHRGADLLILDEPTAVLGPIEIDRLFRTLRGLCSRGASVVVITHKLSEVLDIADRVTVLRRGELTTTAERPDINAASLAVAMFGRELPPLPSRVGATRSPKSAKSAAVLEVSGLSRPAQRGSSALEGISFQVHAGEIVGVVGVEGNGQTELMRVLSGLEPRIGGRIHVNGRPMTSLDARELRAAGVAVITDDRQRFDVSLAMTVEENLALVDLPGGRFVRGGLIDRRRLRAWATALLQEFDVQPPNPITRLRRLSGGNQQKVVVARELSWGPALVLASHPTRGLDLGASDFVFRRLVQLAENGGAVVLNSGDLDEIWAIADRVIVLYRGRVSLDAPISELTLEAVAHAMTTGTPVEAGAP